MPLQVSVIPGIFLILKTLILILINFNFNFKKMPGISVAGGPSML
jgi:hypothetical protein